MRVLSVLLIMFSCFPYISLFPIPTDTQPYALVCGILVFFSCKKRKWNRQFQLLLIVCIIAFCFFLLSGLTFNALRSFLNYFCLFVLTYASYYVLDQNKGLNFNLYKTIVYIWFVVGSIQTFAYSDFLTFLLPRGTSEDLLDSGRGVLGLAPEPTHYGLTCLLLMILGYVNWGWQSCIKRIYILLLIQIFAYSISSMTIFIIAFTLLSYCVYDLFHSRNFLLTLSIIIVISIIAFAVIDYYLEQIQTYRVGKLVNLLLNDPGLFLVLDESVNERFMHIYIPMRGFVENFFLPHGFDSFEPYFEQFLRKDDTELISSYMFNKDSVEKIQSAWGAAFFELGIFAVLIVNVFKVTVSSIYERKEKFVVSLVLFLVFLNAFPFSTPLASLILGNMMYQHDREKIYQDTVWTPEGL